MDIQKEREAFKEYIISKHKNRSPLILTQRIQHGFSENYIVQGVQDCWETWQAAKAQAVPEGFVLVDKHQLAQLMANMDSFGKKALGDDYVSFADIAAVLDEAQEQSHECPNP